MTRKNAGSENQDISPADRDDLSVHDRPDRLPTPDEERTVDDLEPKLAKKSTGEGVDKSMDESRID